MKYFTFILSILMMISFTAHAQEIDSVVWESLGIEDGIENYSAVKPDHKYNSVRGVLKLAMPAERIIEEILDAEKAAKWMHRVERAEVIAHDSDGEPIYQFEWNVPWPFHNRKVILSWTVERDEAAKRVAINYTDYKGSVAGVKEKHRMRDFLCTWVVTALPDGNTEIDLVIDPTRKGKVPAWFVNLFFKEAATKTLNNLREELSR